MKFNQLSAFEKHLKSDPDHLSEVYLIVDGEVYVQRKLAHLIPQADETLEEKELESLTRGELKEILETRSLFTPKKCVILYGLDKMPKSLEEPLLKYIEAPQMGVRLVMCSNKFSALCTKMSKRVIALDLTAEKPWERDSRLSDYVTKKLGSEKLFISSALAEQVVKICGGKVSQIDQELEKLICLLDGQSEVRREDLSFLLKSQEYTLFKVAEALIEKRGAEALMMIHQMKFPTILVLYALRSFFQKSLRQKEMPTNQWHQISPYLKGRLLEKSERQLRGVSARRIQEMIQTLFEIEVLMKSQSLSEEFLQSLMLLKLQGPHEPVSV